MKKQAYNPYLPPYEYIPDGEPYVFGDRVYVYGSHDYFNCKVFCQGDYVCWSAPVDDLSDWKYEGVIYYKNQDPVNKDGRMNLFAPDVTVGPDGRYYLYYVYDKVNFVSVAVCDTPAGNYEFYGYVHYNDGVRLGEREGDEAQFDPGLITIGDKTYMFTGFSFPTDKSRHGSMVTVLDKDMLTIIEEPKFIAPSGSYDEGTGFEDHSFFEASSIRERNGKYYFVYSSEVMHELCYAMSDRIDGGFEYKGVIVSNCDIGIDSYKPANKPMAYGANNHGSIIEINGKWYIFYHRHTNGTWYSRQGCIEPISFNEDGTINQVEITSCGPNNGPLKGEGEYPAYIACNLFTDNERATVCQTEEFPRVTQDGVDGDENAVSYIDNMKNSATAGFKYFDCKNINHVAVTTLGYTNCGKIEVRTSYDGELLGEIEIPDTNVWVTFENEIRIPDGINAIYLTYRGTGTCCLKSFELKH